MTQELVSTVTVFVTQALFAPFIMLLLEFRTPVKRWRAGWVCGIAAVIAANLCLIFCLGFDFYSRYGVLTLILPYVAVTLICSRYKGLRVIFSVMSAFYIAVFGGANGYMAQALFPGLLWLPLAVRLASFGLLFLLFKRFGKAYKRILRELDEGWPVLSLIPLGTCLFVLYVNRAYFKASPLDSAVLVYAPILICGCAFYIMYLFFGRVWYENDVRSSRVMLQLQSAALRERTEAVASAAEAVRLEKHDLRHRLAASAELIRRGKCDEALRFLDAAQERLDDYSPIQWCRQPVLDAVFGFCYERARACRVRFETQIELPDTLPVDEAELAIVLANALDNAIRACERLPEAERSIHCKLIGRPRLMLELKKPCPGGAEFDEDGLPVTDQPGHGFGTQSILAFCRKYGALCRYDCEGGIFSLRLIF